MFDLSTEGVSPHQLRKLKAEQGGISELCWIADDVIAVGTTRGKIITFASKNKSVSFFREMNINADRGLQERFFLVDVVEAHGDGVTQIAVDSMTYLPQISCLASVGEGKISIMLWNVDKDGKFHDL
jgi:hypothetical protein